MKIAHVLPIAVSAVMPGCGHIAAGRTARGLLVFFLFGFAVDGFFYSQALSILPPEHAAVAPGLVCSFDRSIAGTVPVGGSAWQIP